MKERASLVGLGWIFMLCFLMVADLGHPAAPLAAQEMREVRIGDGKGDWGYPNPYRHYPRGPGYIRMSWVFDTLIWKDKDGYVPCLARSWQYDPRSKTFTFELQKGVKWHDGEPFTAEDVAFTINYFKKHPYPWVPLDSVYGAEARGPHTVTIRLKRPDASFLAYVGGTMPVIPKHVWKDVDDPRRYMASDAFVGTGPFRFKDFNKAKGTYLYESNRDYFLGTPRVERLIYIKTGKPMMSLLGGKADLVNIRPEMASILKKKGMVVIESRGGWNKKLMINHRRPPLDDKRFRKALAYAINREELIAKAHRGFGVPASFGLLPPAHELYNPHVHDYRHDPLKAGEILESLGYTKGKDGFYEKDGEPLELELLCSNISVSGDSVRDRDGEVIKRELENAGIGVKLVNLEQASTDARVRNWEFDLAISGHGGLLGDAKILNRMISPKAKGSVNSARYGANRELLRLLKAQVAEMDPHKRKQMVWRIQEIYADELPAISLYYPVSMWAYAPRKEIDWYFTRGGIALGIPIPQNRLSLVR